MGREKAGMGTYSDGLRLNPSALPGAGAGPNSTGPRRWFTRGGGAQQERRAVLLGKPEAVAGHVLGFLGRGGGSSTGIPAMRA